MQHWKNQSPHFGWFYHSFDVKRSNFSCLRFFFGTKCCGHITFEYNVTNEIQIQFLFDSMVNHSEQKKIEKKHLKSWKALNLSFYFVKAVVVTIYFFSTSSSQNETPTLIDTHMLIYGLQWRLKNDKVLEVVIAFE